MEIIIQPPFLFLASSLRSPNAQKEKAVGTSATHGLFSLLTADEISLQVAST